MNDKKLRGRPKKNDAKKERFVVACTLDDKIKIEAAAQKSGTSVSSFVLNCIKQFI